MRRTHSDLKLPVFDYLNQNKTSSALSTPKAAITNSDPLPEKQANNAVKKETKAPIPQPTKALPVSTARPRVYFDVSIDNKTNEGFRIVMEVRLRLLLFLNM